MSREEFIKSYLRSLSVSKQPGGENHAQTRVILELIGSIWDLQQQITQLQDDLYAK